jgi:16S rRNA processing protein RimM
MSSSSSQRSAADVIETPPDDALQVAVVGRPHGVRGELRLFPTSEQPDRLVDLTRVWLVKEKGQGPRRFEFKSLRLHGRTALVFLDGVEGRDAAADWTGAEVWGMPAELPAWGPDEFGLVDVVGRELHDGAELVGTVIGLESISGRDYFQVKANRKVFLVPAVKDWLESFDGEGGKLVMHLPEGLLAAQEASA